MTKVLLFLFSCFTLCILSSPSLVWILNSLGVAATAPALTDDQRVALNKASLMSSLGAIFVTGVYSSPSLNGVAQQHVSNFATALLSSTLLTLCMCIQDQAARGRLDLLRWPEGPLMCLSFLALVYMLIVHMQ